MLIYVKLFNTFLYRISRNRTTINKTSKHKTNCVRIEYNYVRIPDTNCSKNTDVYKCYEQLYSNCTRTTFFAKQ